MTLRPGLVVESVRHGGFFLLLFERRLTPGILSWRMLSLDRGRLTAEFSDMLLDSTYYRELAQP